MQHFPPMTVGFWGRRLEETDMLLQAQRDVNRGLDKDVHDLMGQLEDLNRRYAALGRRTASLQVWQPPAPGPAVAGIAVSA